MSTYFDLLQKAGLQGTPFQSAAAAQVCPSPDGARYRLSTTYPMADDELTRLVLRLFVLPQAQMPRTVVVCDVETEHGAAFICARAAEVLASHVRATVCVVDADLHSPSLHTYFGIANEPGFADALFSTKHVHDFATQVDKSNLWIIPAGECPPAMADFDSLRACILRIRSQFDYVLLNAPPLNGSEQGAVLGQLGDGAVLVVQAESTYREAALRAKRSLEHANVRLLGAVLNNRSFPIPEKIYRNI